MNDRLAQPPARFQGFRVNPCYSSQSSYQKAPRLPHIIVKSFRINGVRGNAISGCLLSLNYLIHHSKQSTCEALKSQTDHLHLSSKSRFYYKQKYVEIHRVARANYRAQKNITNVRIRSQEFAFSIPLIVRRVIENRKSCILSPQLERLSLFYDGFISILHTCLVLTPMT